MNKINMLKAFVAMVVIKKLLVWLFTFILTLLVMIYPPAKEIIADGIPMVPKWVGYSAGYALGLAVTFFIFKWCVEFFILPTTKEKIKIANKESDPT